jgi:hypothetical protein
MIVDLINKLFEDNLISKEQYESLSPLKKPYEEKFGNFLVTGGFLTQEVLETFLKENDQFLFGLFDQFLKENSKVADAIIWRANSSKKNSNGIPKPYNNWSASKKMELSTTFWSTLLDLLPGLEEAPPYTVNVDDDGKVISTDLKPEDAWKYYLNYVAHCLRVELDRLVHWSILKYNEEKLELLLDSRTLFEYFESRNAYAILRRHGSLFNHGSATPGDPVRIYDFLDKEKLIGITRWGTIGLLLGWCRDHLYHFKDGDTPQNYQDHWQYQGYPPVERIISGTKHLDLGLQHFTAGCWGTTGFLRTVLRTINIPVVLEEQCNHALPHFVYNASHEFYLSHGDDPYNKLYKTNTPKFPPLDLIIDKYKFDEWFNKDLPPETICNNVGRHAFELAVEYIPDEVLKIYCDDLAKGKTPENGRLYNEIFRNHLSLKELYSFEFWNRVKEKIDRSGGCKKINKE